MLLALFSSAVHLLASYQSGSISQKQQSISRFIRYFTPQSEQFEDAVTGSAHCSLAPLWAQRMWKARLEARQISMRGGRLTCDVMGDSVAVEGAAVTYMRGKIVI